jgi:heme exporter protein A
MTIQVRNLTKAFGPRLVLRKLNFDVGAGEFVILLGPNGAGKTTLIRILASLVRPAFGEVHVAGYHLPYEAAQVRRRIGVLSHQPLLYGDLTAEQNLRFYGRMYDLADLSPRVEKALDQVGLAARRRDPVRSFSRGMQQRLSLARALLHEPQVLLFDEPYTGLDQQASEMLDELLRATSAAGRTIVMSSHDLLRAATLGDRVDVLSRGTIAASWRRGEFAFDKLPSLYQEAVDARG